MHWLEIHTSSHLLQGMLVTEQWVDRIARMLKKAPEQIRELNFLKEGETTHFGQVMECSQVKDHSNP